MQAGAIRVDNVQVGGAHPAILAKGRPARGRKDDAPVRQPDGVCVIVFLEGICHAAELWQIQVVAIGEGDLPQPGPIDVDGIDAPGAGVGQGRGIVRASHQPGKDDFPSIERDIRGIDIDQVQGSRRRPGAVHQGAQGPVRLADDQLSRTCHLEAAVGSHAGHGTGLAGAHIDATIVGNLPRDEHDCIAVDL